MGEVYRCIRTFNIDNDLIEKTCINIQKTMLLRRYLKLLVTLSAHLFEDHILNQINSIEVGIGDKTEVHIELSRQIGKRLERRYKDVTDYPQSHTSQIKLQHLISSPILLK